MLIFMIITFALTAFGLFDEFKEFAKKNEERKAIIEARKNINIDVE